MNTSVINNQTTVITKGDLTATVMRGIDDDGQFTSRSGLCLVGPDGLSLAAANVPTAVAIELAKSMIRVLIYPEPGSAIPGQPGYVVGTCGHRVAKSEYRAGFRSCERCH